jgi:hypothetical protein
MQIEMKNMYRNCTDADVKVTNVNVTVAWTEI